MVLNTDYGGFSINTEMALWLSENREWNVISEKEYNYKKKDEYPITTIVDMRGDYFYSPCGDTIEFRSNKDLIDCVRAVKLAHENDSFPESRYGHINKLNIIKVGTLLEIEDYHDGKERVICHVAQTSEDEYKGFDWY